jgi:hypothetical protein
MRPASDNRLRSLNLPTWTIDCAAVWENRLSFDLPVRPAPKRKSSPQPQVRLLGRGQIQVSHLGLFRDTYYISQATLRANEEDPFKLEKHEFFVCGDNSPNSLDARLWSEEGKGITNQPAYRMGIVPMEYMMGKAFLVYWSDAYSPMPNMLPVIPNIDRIKSSRRLRRGLLKGESGLISLDWSVNFRITAIISPAISSAILKAACNTVADKTVRISPGMAETYFAPNP